MNLPVCHSLIAMAVHVVVLLILCLGFNMGIYGVIISYVIYALVITILNFYSIGKILEYRPDVITLFVSRQLPLALWALSALDVISCCISF